MTDNCHSRRRLEHSYIDTRDQLDRTVAALGRLNLDSLSDDQLHELAVVLDRLLTLVDVHLGVLDIDQGEE